MEFRKHDVEWTDEKVKNFWDYFVTNKGLLELSFAKEAGKEILRIIKPYIKSDGSNLDYGCGGGGLLEYFFQNGIACAGLDSSMKSLDLVKKKFTGNPFFKGVIFSNKPPHDIANESYDFIVCVEIVEHIFPNRLPSVFKEMHRLLKPGGYVFITTPFNENLGKYKVICPDCGAVFHRVQHMNTFTIESLIGLMENASFTTIKCEHTLFQKQRSWFHLVKYTINGIYAKIKKEKIFSPHLYYLGQKSSKVK